MKKVLILNAILYSSENGERKFTHINDCLMITVCKGFIANGYMPTLIVDEYYKPLINDDLEFQIVYLQHFLPSIFSPYYMPFPLGLIKYLREHGEEYDFIISSEVFSWYSYISAKVLKNRLIVWQELAIHNRIFGGYASRIWYGIVGRLTFRNVLIAARSERAKTFIKSYCKNVDSNVYQHPVDIHKFDFGYKKNNCFISISQLIERKRVEKIIIQFSEFHKVHTDYVLYICGDGDKKSELQNLCIELNIQDSVFFKGLVNHVELSDMLNRAKALLVYTQKDNSILTISEAIASGTPIITTSIPDNAEYVTKTITGIVRDCWDVQDLELICEKNEYYIANCAKVREELTNVSLAKQFICLSEKLAINKIHKRD